MTEQKSTQLGPEEWKHICVLNCQQLVNFLSALPAMEKVDGSDMAISGMTLERMTQVDEHLERLVKVLLPGWVRSRPIGAKQPEKVEPPKVPEANGAVAPVKKRGRPRKVVEAQASQH